MKKGISTPSPPEKIPISGYNMSLIFLSKGQLTSKYMLFFSREFYFFQKNGQNFTIFMETRKKIKSEKLLDFVKKIDLPRKHTHTHIPYCEPNLKQYLS